MLRLMYLILMGNICAGQAFGEVATDNRRWPHMDLIYQEADGRVYRAECVEDTELYDRGTCSNNIRHADPEKFFPLFRAMFGKRLEDMQLKVQDHWTNIQRIDLRIMELAQGQTPNDPNAPTLEDVNAADQALTEKQTVVADIRDQISRAEQRLVQNPDDDVLEQLRVLQVRLSELTAEAEGLREALIAVRIAYTEARVNESDDDYQRLIRMRDSQVESLGNARQEVKRQLDDVLIGERTSQRMREVGFTWIDDSSSPLPGGNQLSQAFIAAELATRTFSFSSNQLAHTVRIQVGRAGRLEHLQCRFGIPLQDESQSCAIHFYAPENRHSVYSFDYLRQRFEFSTDHSFLRRQLEIDGVYDRLSAGEWRISLGCDSQDWTPREEETVCDIRLVYE